MALHITYYVLMIAVLLCGLFINILTLPGLWLMAGAYGLYGWLTGWNHYVGWPSFGAILALTVIAEGVELLAGGAGAKKAGASKRAMIGAVVGALLGAIFLTIPFPIVGTIIGVCLGAAIGAGVVEFMVRRDYHQSIDVARGAFTGRFMGIVSKVGIGTVILLIAIICGWPH